MHAMLVKLLSTRRRRVRVQHKVRTTRTQALTQRVAASRRATLAARGGKPYVCRAYYFAEVALRMMGNSMTSWEQQPPDMARRERV